jgi:hypothetical protein
MKRNQRQQIYVFDKTIDPDTILVIVPYLPPFDPDRAIHEDLNSTLILRGRPHRLYARRSVDALADHLGFRLSDGHHPIAINPADHVIVAEEKGRSVLVMSRRGEKHRIKVPALPLAVQAALDAPIRNNNYAGLHASAPWLQRVMLR